MLLHEFAEEKDAIINLDMICEKQRAICVDMECSGVSSFSNFSILQIIWMLLFAIAEDWLARWIKKRKINFPFGLMMVAVIFLKKNLFFLREHFFFGVLAFHYGAGLV